MSHGSDVCYCGDYRSQHNGANGFCKVCGCSGYKEGRPASKDEQKHWNQYHGKHAPVRMQPGREERDV